MGIYVKGMEMPTDGSMIFAIRPDGMVEDVMGCYVGKAIPVPPHGRLIEKGALLDKCYQHYEDFMWGKVDGKTALLNIEKEIKTAQAIIPASEEAGEK